MHFDRNLVAQLAKKYLDGIASEEEKKMLHEWYDTINAGDTEIVFTKTPQTIETFGAEIFTELKQLITEEKAGKTGGGIMRRLTWKWVAAAAMTLSLGAATWFILQRKPAYVLTGKKEHQLADVKAPASLHAVLTLQNGKKIILDSIPNGQLANQGSTNVLKQTDGRIVYDAGDASLGEVHYNTLTVPRGCKIVYLQLSDGTTVVLNSASSITYPAVFSENERKVEITGEVYFEVSKTTSIFTGKGGKKIPFVVEILPAAEAVRGRRVEVLGTHFNVNSYPDEDAVRVTLLEGKVKVVNHQSSFVNLKPGQEAQISNQSGKSNIHVINDPDLDATIAWKNGWFQFNSLKIEDIMRQISRWYDVDVTYETSSQKRFSGIVSRNGNMSDVLKIMEQAGIKFRIEEKKITVLK